MKPLQIIYSMTSVRKFRSRFLLRAVSNLLIYEAGFDCFALPESLTNSSSVEEGYSWANLVLRLF